MSWSLRRMSCLPWRKRQKTSGGGYAGFTAVPVHAVQSRRYSLTNHADTPERAPVYVGAFTEGNEGGEA